MGKNMYVAHSKYHIRDELLITTVEGQSFSPVGKGSAGQHL